MCNSTCIICTESKHVIPIGPCGHHFCNMCTNEWLEKSQTCPMCRKVISIVPMKSHRSNFFSNEIGLHRLSRLMGL